MKGGYQKTLEELGGAPEEFQSFKWPQCSLHYPSIMMGVFTEKDGHRQGEITTHRQLVGYISLFRVGNIMLYSQILGHGDHLKKGIMYLLHLEIMMSLLHPVAEHYDGIDYLMYAAWKSGTEGLQYWKKLCLFEPMRLEYEAT